MLLFFAYLPKEDFPGCRPPAWRFHWQFTKQVGGGWGSSRKGRFGGDCLSERGGPSKVFFYCEKEISVMVPMEPAR